MLKLFACLFVINFYISCIYASSDKNKDATNLQSSSLFSVKTNLSHYSPFDTVLFTVTLNNIITNGTLQIKYFHLSEKIFEQSITLTQSTIVKWDWIPPKQNHSGYLAEIILMQANQELDKETIAIDVSSDWNYFPRYGFLSNYPQLSNDSIKSVIETLNRYHINGIQFYDWQYKHNMPLKGTPDNPAQYWNDIANRTIYFSTVKKYIDESHNHNMKAMAYNLIYGAYSDAYQDGVNIDEWGLYKDNQHQNRFMYTLPAGWASNLYFMDPSNKYWQEYLINQEKRMFQALPFDGWHVDQVGDNGSMYNYQGQPISVSNTFNGFLQIAKDSLKVNLVMNAVNQYGQAGIAASPVDFLYSEVWDPNNSYTDLARIISTNSLYSKGRLNTVLAAYVNYNIANSPGYFNTPGVILLDAVIFAAGGSHIELGEHMLGKEYFPNNNLKMRDDLKNAMISYYDFLTAYENVLRDSINSVNINITTSSNISLSNSIPKQGTVWCFSKKKENLQTIHLINFVKANSLQWRDANGTQPEPDSIPNIVLTIAVSSKVNKIWIASPDYNNCLSADLPFTENDGYVSFTVPLLNYWDMIVIEYSNSTTSIKKENNTESGYSLEQNYPNPFNPETIIPFRMKDSGNVQFTVYNVLGRKVFSKIVHAHEGDNAYNFNGSGLESGVYFCKMQVYFTRHLGSTVGVKKIILLK